MSRSGSFLGLLTVVACGGSSTQPTKPQLTNTISTQAEPARNDVVKDALAALAAGDVERLMTLADPKAMYDYAFSCKDDRNDGDMASDAKSLETALRDDFTKAVDKAKGARIEVVSIRNEMRGWNRRSRDRNATFIAKGGALSSACVAKTDVMFHEVEVRVKISKDGTTSENKTRLDLVHARGRWFVSKIPRDLSASEGGAAGAAVAKMEEFQTQMCTCKDKACADKVNEDMTKWGTEMARNAGAARDERPDPDLARKSADIMTKYTECMTKLMMAGAGNP